MLGLKTAMHDAHSDAITVVCPENCQPVHFEFTRPSLVSLVGEVAGVLANAPSFPRGGGSDRTHE